MDVSFPLKVEKLNKKQVEELAKNGIQYALANGILLSSPDGQTLRSPSFMLFPSPFPKKLFDQAKEVQQDFNILLHNVCQDHEFLKNSLHGTIAADDFTARIFNIYEQTRNEGISQPISLNLVRSDYMLDTDQQTDINLNKCDEQMSIKQVEINTIAAGANHFASELPGLHSYVLGLMDKDVPVGSPQLPRNSPLSGIAEGLAQAWEMYGNKRAVTLLVASGDDSCIFDQTPIEYYLHRRSPRIKMIRRSLPELYETAKLDDNKKLIVDGFEVAVVYYRSGYSPEDYPTEGAWFARLLVERSLAIKCPTTALHLLTTKKIQQVLAKPGVLERFISDEGALRRIRKTFTGLYTLDEGLEGDHNAKMAIQDPENYVLKPQREGGGNNIYDDGIKTTLKQLKMPHERSQYILMDKIRPPPFKNYIVRAGEKPELTDVISEFGVFGVLISFGDQVLVNRQVGYLLRTKCNKIEDGGVTSGRAGYDSPYLINNLLQ